MSAKSRRVSVVPHTHWDREWYRPFQSFRSDLVALLDELLPRLEADPAVAHFMLDGQMAVVDDYLQIRPEATDRIRALATAGRLGVGPWYILMDEFLVSGETIVRNLAMGLDRAAQFGGAMRVGYLPDMFGHIAQMPQILAQFGFEHAVVWRGTPSAVDRTGFWWSAPDGSTVRAEYLPQGYGNGARLPDDAKDLVDHIRQFDQVQAGLIDGGPILWMNGTDHLVPSHVLGRVVAEANALTDDYDIAIRPLADHLDHAPTEGLPSWTGELRSGARANLLMGVASNRTDVRQAAARAERALERVAEPLATMAAVAAGEPWPATFLDLAWRNLVLNSAHDSVCACSVDEVCDAVLVRYAEATRIADAVARQSARAIAHRVARPGPVVVNTSTRTRSGLVELSLPGNGPAEGLQLLSEEPELSHVHTVTRADAPTVVERELDIHLGVQGIEIHHHDGALDVTLHVDPADRRLPTFGWAIAELRSLAADDPTGAVRVWVRQPPTRRALVRIADVPGLGWSTWDPTPTPVEPVSVGVDGTSLSNGLATVEVDTVDGTFSVNGHHGLGRLVDDGDEGDTYNFSPPARQQVIDRPESVDVEVIETGPLRASVAVTAAYTWPERIVGGERVGQVTTEIVTTLELHAGERFVRVTTTVDNHARDHRLRVHLPLPQPATHSEAECAFGIVRRGLTTEGGETEHALPTFPSRRFVQAGGLTVAHEGLLEYELVDAEDGAERGAVAHTLAVTLLRCTGWLSRGPMTYRPLPAGPEIETPGAQMQGRHALRWAIHVATPGEDPLDPYALVDDAFVPFVVTRAGGGGTLPARHQTLEVHGAQVSAVLHGGPRAEVRAFNPSDEATTVEVPGRSGWVLDLGGRPVTRFDERVELAPWRIATLSLDPRSSLDPQTPSSS
jgi:mannosylglycerate hydrolase